MQKGINMKIRKIPLFKVHIPKTVLTPLKQTLFSGYIAEGEKAALFEKKIGEWLGNENTAIVNSGTSALTLALYTAGVKYGDEVISTAQTCLATNEPILTLGGKVIWADVDKTNGNIDPESIEKLITKKTKAIMVVHWTGIPVDLEKIHEIAKKHNLKVIEDAAHAFGSVYKGEKIGNHSDFVCYSFQAIKHLTTGDGGAIACKRKEDYERIKLLRWFGAPRIYSKTSTHWDIEVKEPGFKMHMNDISATIGIEQLKYVDKIVTTHKNNGKYLQEELSKIKGMTTLRVPKDTESAYWIFGLLLENKDKRDLFSKYLSEKGIANSVVHIRNDIYELFRNTRRNLPGLDNFSSKMINIPCGWWLKKADLSYIVKIAKEAMKDIERSKQ